nr:hypothetical protein [Methanobacterium formicicum]
MEYPEKTAGYNMVNNVPVFNDDNTLAEIEKHWRMQLTNSQLWITFISLKKITPWLVLFPLKI